MSHWEPEAVKKASLDTSLRALEEFEQHGKVLSVKCERCGALIKIVPLSHSARQMSCPCGLYSDTLRGL